MGKEIIEKFVSKSKKYEELKKNPVVAVFLSIIFLGLGQIYCGKVVKAIIFWAGMFFTMIIMALNDIVGLILMVVIWFYNVIDAYMTAKKYNEELMELILSRLTPKKREGII